ncbi:MAG: hypothetical protein BMS9Abin25_1146 [Gammaproteobacteria bacterium]|nr:MAG: hypothetical protein BMS9Abin25_1146 [Gammaproteobacteria bacterium]
MAKLREDIKRMLSALAYQDADEYLSSHEKMKILGYGPEVNTEQSLPARKIAKRTVSPRIALIIDGQGPCAPLTYTIDACQRQDAQVDLLLHGAIDTKSIEMIENKIIEAGIDYQRIKVGMNAVDDITEYIFSQSTLIYIVALSDDVVVRELIEEALPKRGLRIPVPLVLMNGDKSSSTKKQSAA